MQPRLAIIFRGQGKRISAAERAAWDPRVDVYFQKNAWADRAFCLNWTRRTWRAHVEQHHTAAPPPPDETGTPPPHVASFEETLHLFGNLDGQTHEAHTTALKVETNSRPYFYPFGETDNLAPPDAGYGKDAKFETGVELGKWLDDAGNLEKWESNKLTASDRRILMAVWAASAKERVDKKYYSL